MTDETSSLLEVAEGVRYRFFTRRNGVSEGEYASLNCSEKSGDDPVKVRENMRRIASNLNCTVEKIFTLRQTHSSIVIPILDAEPLEQIPYGDALVTTQENIYLGIQTADCAPVIFADMENRIIGAAHAGWRGAAGGVLENTLEAMVEIGAVKENITAVIGPCIAPQSYEVGQDMYDEFLKADVRSSLFFVPTESGKYRFDLPGYVLARLERAEIGAAEWVGTDTYLMEDDYFSYRRSSQKGEKCGRQLSVIGLLDDSLF